MRSFESSYTSIFGVEPPLASSTNGLREKALLFLDFFGDGIASSAVANRLWKSTLEAELRTSLGSCRFVRGVFAGVGSEFVLAPFVPVPNKLSLVKRVLCISSSDDSGVSRRCFRALINVEGRLDSFVGDGGACLVGDSGDMGEECRFAATRLDRLGVNGVQLSSCAPHRGAGGVCNLIRVEGGVALRISSIVAVSIQLPENMTRFEIDEYVDVRVTRGGKS
jgi:hypothetical protein